MTRHCVYVAMMGLVAGGLFGGCGHRADAGTPKSAQDAEFGREDGGADWEEGGASTGARAQDAGTPSGEGGSGELADLVFYARSDIAQVRLRAVTRLAAYPGETARMVLEERVVSDANVRVRSAAARVLWQWGSTASIPALEKAFANATSSEERALLRGIIDDLTEGKQVLR